MNNILGVFEPHFKEIHRRLELLENEQKELKKQMAITQAQVDAITGIVTTLDTTTVTILSEVQALEAANPNLDLSGLTAATTKLQIDINNVQGVLAGSPATS